MTTSTAAQMNVRSIACIRSIAVSGLRDSRHFLLMSAESSRGGSDIIYKCSRALCGGVGRKRSDMLISQKSAYTVQSAVRFERSNRFWAACNARCALRAAWTSILACKQFRWTPTSLQRRLMNRTRYSPTISSLCFLNFWLRGAAAQQP